MYCKKVNWLYQAWRHCLCFIRFTITNHTINRTRRWTIHRDAFAAKISTMSKPRGLGTNTVETYMALWCNVVKRHIASNLIKFYSILHCTEYPKNHFHVLKVSNTFVRKPCMRVNFVTIYLSISLLEIVRFWWAWL